MTSEVLRLGPRITCLPVIHGSGDFAVAVRRLMLEQSFDCVAVPLPPSFQADVERGIELLPSPTMVTQAESPQYGEEWSPESEDAEADDSGDAADFDGEAEAGDEEPTHSYVP